MENESSRMSCNFVCHYLQVKTYLINSQVLIPTMLKGNLNMQGPHLKAVAALP